MFDLAWLETELAGLMVQLHRIEGAIEVLQQMKAQLNTGAAQVAPDSVTLAELETMLPAGYTIDTERGIQPHEG